MWGKKWTSISWHIWIILVKVLVAYSCPILCNPMYCCSPPGSPCPDKNTGVGCHSLLQGIFPGTGFKPGSPTCRQILYQLSPQGSPWDHFKQIINVSSPLQQNHPSVFSLQIPIPTWIHLNAESSWGSCGDSWHPKASARVLPLQMKAVSSLGLPDEQGPAWVLGYQLSLPGVLLWPTCRANSLGRKGSLTLVMVVKSGNAEQVHWGRQDDGKSKLKKSFGRIRERK